MDDGIAVTRRTLLGGVATLGLAGAGAGAGTAALFSDRESSTGNTVQSGTLNLTLDGSDATVTFLVANGIAPGDSGQSTLTVANTGSVAGYLDVEVTSVTVYENGCVGNEKSGEDSNTCGDPGQGEGELQDHLETEAYFQNGDTLWSRTTVATEPNTGDVYDLDYQLAGGTSDTFVLDWWLPSDTGREVQSDSVEFALTFSLDQQTDSGA